MGGSALGGPSLSRHQLCIVSENKSHPMSKQIAFLSLRADDEVLEDIEKLAVDLPEHDRLISYRANRYDLSRIFDDGRRPVAITPVGPVDKQELVDQAHVLIDRLRGGADTVRATIHYMDRDHEDVDLKE